MRPCRSTMIMATEAASTARRKRSSAKGTGGSVNMDAEGSRGITSTPASLPGPARLTGIDTGLQKGASAGCRGAGTPDVAGASIETERTSKVQFYTAARWHISCRYDHRSACLDRSLAAIER